MYTILSVTPKSLTVLFKGKKRKLDTWSKVVEFLLDLNTRDKKIINEILKSAQFLTKENIADLKKQFCPTTAQLKKAKENANKLEKWANTPNKELDAIENRMASQRGFLGHGITKEDVKSSVPAELLPKNY